MRTSCCCLHKKRTWTLKTKAQDLSLILLPNQVNESCLFKLEGKSYPFITFVHFFFINKQHKITFKLHVEIVKFVLQRY